MDPWTLLGTAVIIVCGLIGIIYWAGQSRDDKQDARHERNEKDFKDHVRDDTQAYERIRAIEADLVHIKSEINKLRDLRHEIMEFVRKALADWYLKVVEVITKRWGNWNDKD